MTSRILKLVMPVDAIGGQTLENIRKLTGTEKVTVEYSNTIVIVFGYDLSLSKLNSYIIMISQEVGRELYSIFQNPSNCTATFK